MKKLMAIAILSALMLALCACGGDDTENSSGQAYSVPAVMSSNVSETSETSAKNAKIAADFEGCWGTPDGNCYIVITDYTESMAYFYDENGVQFTSEPYVVSGDALYFIESHTMVYLDKANDTIDFDDFILSPAQLPQ